MSKPAIRFEGVTLTFGSRTLFENLNVAIADKKITAILGKSGSGKSSLLQLVNGLLKPTFGKVFLFGVELDYQQIHKARMGIGYAVQQVGLFPHLSVYENITLPGVLAGWSTKEQHERATELMTLVNLNASLSDKYPHQISGGEQQRVGLCRAILLNPPLMLLDESFSSLDPETKNDIHQEVLKLQAREPRCIIMVTHDPDEASRLGDYQLKFENGQLIPTAS